MSIKKSEGKESNMKVHDLSTGFNKKLVISCAFCYLNGERGSLFLG